MAKHSLKFLFLSLLFLPFSAFADSTTTCIHYTAFVNVGNEDAGPIIDVISVNKAENGRSWIATSSDNFVSVNKRYWNQEMGYPYKTVCTTSGGGSSTSTASSTINGVVTYRDWLFMNGLIIFLLSFVPLGIFMQFFHIGLKKK